MSYVINTSQRAYLDILAVILIAFVLGALVVAGDVLKYRDLQRRLREERTRREEVEE